MAKERRTAQVTDKEIEKIIEQVKEIHKGTSYTETTRAMLKAFAIEKASNNISNALDRLSKSILEASRERR